MEGTPPYVELHCHSAFSFLDGVSLPDELIQRAAELGHTTLALTDHNSVSGSMELAQAARDRGVRAIHGAEIDLAPVVRGERDGGDEQDRPGPHGGEPGARHLTLLVGDALQSQAFVALTSSDALSARSWCASSRGISFMGARCRRHAGRCSPSSLRSSAHGSGI